MAEQLMINNTHRLLAIMATMAAALLSTACLGQSAADAWPAKPVMFIVASTAGAAQDIETRLYANRLGELLPGKTFLIDYKPGAGGTIAAAQVAKSVPDGHTLLTASPGFVIAPMAYPVLPYDPIKGFAPVSHMSKRPSIFLVHPSVPARNMQEYIAHAKANPGKLNAGTSAVGGIAELALSWLHHMAGIKVTLIHYKGAAPSYNAVLSNEVDAVMGGTSAMLPHVKSGKVRLLGVATPERPASLSDIPTIAEQGLPGYEYYNWIGYLAAAGTPSAIVNRISTELGKVAQTPAIAQKLAADGALMVGSTPEQFRQYLAEESQRWRNVVQTTGVKLAQ